MNNEMSIQVHGISETTATVSINGERSVLLLSDLHHAARQDDEHLAAVYGAVEREVEKFAADHPPSVGADNNYSRALRAAREYADACYNGQTVIALQLRNDIYQWVGRIGGWDEAHGRHQHLVPGAIARAMGLHRGVAGSDWMAI